MPESEAFLKAICDNPDDDGPRLLYADWLEENGNPDRAEFIRVQCAMAKMTRKDTQWKDLFQREKQLFQANWIEWIRPICEVFGVPIPQRNQKPFWHPSRWHHILLKEMGESWEGSGVRQDTTPPYFLSREGTSLLCASYGPYLSWVKFDRGFIDEIMLYDFHEDTFQQIDRCFSIIPLTGLWLLDSGNHTIGRLVQNERFLHIRRLNIFNPEQDTLQAISESSFVRRLEDLTLEAGYPPPDPSPLRMLAQAQHLEFLRKLSFIDYVLSDDEVRELFQAPFIHQLQRLFFSSNYLSDVGATMIGESNRFRDSKCVLELRRVNLSRNARRILRTSLGDRLIDRK